MQKMKTKKTLKKRIRITKSGKILTKQNRTGHLKVKWSSAKKMRKAKKMTVSSKGFKLKIKRLVPTLASKIK
mgnify:CR=1 FL=1